jgi:hypothetical protein
MRTKFFEYTVSDILKLNELIQAIENGKEYDTSEVTGYLKELKHLKYPLVNEEWERIEKWHRT